MELNIWMIKASKCLTCEGRMSKLGVWPQGEVVQEGSINVYKHLGERIKETEADFSHWAPACTVRSSRNKPKYRKFHPNSPKCPIFTVRGSDSRTGCPEGQ